MLLLPPVVLLLPLELAEVPVALHGQPEPDPSALAELPVALHGQPEPDPSALALLLVQLQSSLLHYLAMMPSV